MYEEPEFDEEGNLIKDSMTEEEKKRRLQINLNNEILMTNSGVPIIFIINKSDNPDNKYEDKAEFILRHIRKVAINYGATIIYTSTKSNYNISILYDYIFHSLLNFDLVHKPNVHDKTSFFIPSGYDRLSILKSNDSHNDLDCEFTDIIKEEKEIKIIEDVIECDKVSDYLKKVKDKLIRSRKSMIRNDLQSGKSLLHSLKASKLENDKEKEKEKAKEKGRPETEKINKFQKFMQKKDDKNGVGVDKEKEKLSKEERQKITRENLLNKLKLSKKDKK